MLPHASDTHRFGQVLQKDSLLRRLRTSYVSFSFVHNCLLGVNPRLVVLDPRSQPWLVYFLSLGISLCCVNPVICRVVKPVS